MEATQQELERITKQIKALQQKKKNQTNQIDLEINALDKKRLELQKRLNNKN